MESRVTLYDSNNVKVGETFVRRARQLVKQQRAKWVDDSLSAVRFTADAEEWEDGFDMMKDESPIPIMPSVSTADDEMLIVLAEKRIRERKFFRLHSILFIPALFFFYAFFHSTMHWRTAEFFFVFMTGALISAYLIHLVWYVQNKRPSHNKEERKARKLAVEMAILRNELKR